VGPRLSKGRAHGQGAKSTNRFARAADAKSFGSAASSEREPEVHEDYVSAYDLVPWSNNQYLHDLLPNTEIHPLDAGHFAWEQAAEEYGSLVADWVSGGYRRVGAS
jgi:pimeloyl-ACP methyl ester carboxylesterase